MTEGPPAAVLAAFRAGGPAVLLEGGQGETFRAGDLVLKPTDDLAETEWVSELLHGLTVGGVRIPQPVRTVDGSWVVDGWAATRWLPGVASPEDRWVEVLDVCDRVHASLARASRPPFLDARHHRWARSDRMTWGEESLAREVLAEASIAGLVGLLQPVDLPNQLIHGDLSGNVLRHPHLEPAGHRLVAVLAPCWLRAGDRGRRRAAVVRRGRRPRGR